MGPYAYKGNQWVGFDDIDTIRYKSNYVKEMGLGGAMIWALDLDDFKNDCAGEAYPLLKTINRQLGLLDTKPADNYELQGAYRLQDEAGKITAEMTSAPYQSKCGGNAMKPHETDCDKFYVCDNEKYVIKSCPAGTHFVGPNCDWPETAKCTLGGSNSQGSNNQDDGNEQDQGNDGADTFGNGMELDDVVVIEQPSNTQGGSKPTKPTTPAPATAPTTTTVATDTVSPPAATDNTGMKVVCYFTNWAWYRPGIGKYVPEDIDASLCTHINYGFAILDPIRLVMRTHDSWADIDNEFYTKLTGLKKSNPGLKVLLALGGWNDSEGDKYSRMVKYPETRKNFIDNAIEFIKEYDFDGLDLDWEYPKCWQVRIIMHSHLLNKIKMFSYLLR